MTKETQTASNVQKEHSGEVYKAFVRSVLDEIINKAPDLHHEPLAVLEVVTIAHPGVVAAVPLKTSPPAIRKRGAPEELGRFTEQTKKSFTTPTSNSRGVAAAHGKAIVCKHFLGSGVEKAEERSILRPGGEVVEVLGEIVHRGETTEVHFVKDVGSSRENHWVAPHRLILAAFQHVGDASVLARLTRLWNSEEWSIGNHVHGRAIRMDRGPKYPKSHELVNKFLRYFEFLSIHGSIGEDLVARLGEEVHGTTQPHVIPTGLGEFPP
jgi:hypothetical protein